MKSPVYNRHIEVNGLQTFYRESGCKEKPVIVLLHGFPTSSHMFRNLLPLLNEQYRVIAPDLIGFGYSAAPNHKEFDYTFDNLAHHIQSFLEKLGIKIFSLYLFDYGALIGFRIAMTNPDRVTAIISQNGNAYEEGLSEGWNPIRKYWEEETTENREALKMFSSAQLTRWQYEQGVSDPELIAPETYTLDQYSLDRAGNIEIQLDLMRDYRSNVALYPEFQDYLRIHQPPFLAVWGGG